VALSSALAVGASASIPAGPVDLGSQLMMRLFGETSDSNASFAAEQGDWTSESPLRDLALQVARTETKPSFSGDQSVALMQSRLPLRDLSPQRDASFLDETRFVGGANAAPFSPPSLPGTETDLGPPDVHFTAAYQPEAPTPAISPAPGTLEFVAPDVHASDFLSTTQIGAVHLEGHSQAATVQTPQLDSSGSYDAGANFDLRAGKRSLNVNLSSEYQHVGDSGPGSLQLSPPGSVSALQLPGAAAPLTLPNDGDVNRLSLGAGVSVPVVRGLTLNVNYDAQRLYGAYGLPGLLNLETVNNTYGGKLTFNIPQISSSLSVGAYQDRFQDGSILPINGTTDTREDVNFTVKF
jgi:hypothetical protein